MVSKDFRRQLDGYGLTTAQILYRLPDHPSLLQTYVWQDYDLCPKFPVLNRFLAFWLETLEGPLHSVTVAHARLIRPAERRKLQEVVHDPDRVEAGVFRRRGQAGDRLEQVRRVEAGEIGQLNPESSHQATVAVNV